MKTNDQKLTFNIDLCQAQQSPIDLVDCLSPGQASYCGFSLAFGNGYFCKHPQRQEFIEKTKKLHNATGPPQVSFGLGMVNRP